MKAKNLSIIYIYYNTPGELADSLATLDAAVGKISYEVIVVDNNSPVVIPRSIVKNKKYKILHLKQNIGYGGAANKGIAVAKGKYVMVVNPDVIFHKSSVLRMVGAMKKNKRIGLLGPRYFDEKSGALPSVSGYPTLPGAIAAFSLVDKIFPNNRYSKQYWMRNFNYDKEKSVPAVGGACMLFRRDAFEKAGKFDEEFFMYFEEADMSKRIRKAGYLVQYFPKAAITHLIGRSTDSMAIQHQYEKSRLTFFKKYHGTIAAVLGESIIRLCNPNVFLLLPILLVSAFLNLYRLDTYMMLYGDFGRDLLVAREMLLTGVIPLLGIPSSVVWLHQGPLSIYIMSVALFFGKFSPVAPAVLYGVMGVGSTVMVYLLGKRFFNQKVGLLASALYATSPIIVMNAREPYHTAPIPFFALLFFLSFWQVVTRDVRYVFISFFFLGLLLQLELSNVVIVILLAVVWWYYRLHLSRQIVIRAFFGLLLGIAPFILYDLTHRFIQIGGLILWTINRVRLFLGLTTAGNATTQEAGNAIATIWAEVVRVIYPLSPTIVMFIIVSASIIILLHSKSILDRKRPSGLFITSLWLGIAIIGYAVHAKPGSAYFPVLYPAIMLLSAFTLYEIYKRVKIILFLIVVMITFNAYYLLINNYFLAGPNATSIPNLYGYHYGLSLEVQEHAVNSILKDAKDQPFSIIGGGFLKDFATSVDNYKYLALWKGGNLQDDAKIRYIIYQDEKEPNGNIIYRSRFLVVVRK
jgi:GT2 family glycosyltransferase